MKTAAPVTSVEIAFAPHAFKGLCAACFRPATTRCSRCLSAPYCSGECQAAAWQSHKHACRGVAQLRAREARLLAAQYPPAAALGGPVRGATPEAVEATLRAARARAARRGGAAAGRLLKALREQVNETCFLFSAASEGRVAEAVNAVALLPPGAVDDRWRCSGPAGHAAVADADRSLMARVGDMSALTMVCTYCGDEPWFTEMATALIDAGADLHHHATHVDGFLLGVTPLTAAANAGNVAGVRLLLARGARAGADAGGQFPLNCIENCDEAAAIEIAGALLDAGADIEGRVADTSESALFCAVLRNRVRVVRYLLSRGASADVLSTSGCRPIDIATTRAGRGACLAALLAAGADTTPLPFLITSGAVTGGGGGDVRPAAGESAPRQVVTRGGFSVCTSWPEMCVEAGGGVPEETLPRVLARAGALDPNHVEIRPQARPLLSVVAAAAGDKVGLARALLAAGADPGRPDANGRGCLWWALARGNRGTTAALIAAGAAPLPPEPATDPRAPARRQILPMYAVVQSRAGAVGVDGAPASASADVPEPPLWRCSETCLAALRDPPALVALIAAGRAAPAGTPCPGCHKTATQTLLFAMLSDAGAATGAKAAPHGIGTVAEVVAALREIARDHPARLGAEALQRWLGNPGDKAAAPHRGTSGADWIAASAPAYLVAVGCVSSGAAGPSDAHLEALHLLATTAREHAPNGLSDEPLDKSSGFAARSVGTGPGGPDAHSMLLRTEGLDAARATPFGRRTPAQARLLERVEVALGCVLSCGRGRVLLDTDPERVARLRGAAVADGFHGELPAGSGAGRPP